MTEFDLIKEALPDEEAKPEFLFAGSHGTREDQQIIIKRFGKLRRWRFDWAWPAHRVAWEIEGGHWVGGRHNIGKGFEGDMEKYNAATALGWSVIRSTTAKRSKEAALEFIKSLVDQRKQIT